MVFVKGFDPKRNYKGRPQGSRSFTTDFDEVVAEIAKQNKMTQSEARKILLKSAYKQATEGNFQYYKDITDRYYGKSPEKLEVVAEVEVGSVSADVIALAEAELKRRKLNNE